MSDQQSGLSPKLEERIVNAYHALEAKNPNHDLLELAYVVGKALLGVTNRFSKIYRLKDARDSAIKRYVVFANHLEAAVQGT